MQNTSSVQFYGLKIDSKEILKICMTIVCHFQYFNFTFQKFLLYEEHAVRVIPY